LSYDWGDFVNFLHGRLSIRAGAGLSDSRKKFKVSLPAHSGRPQVVLYDEYRNVIPLGNHNWSLMAYLNVYQMIAAGAVINPSI
jgi:hypothetical protein